MANIGIVYYNDVGKYLYRQYLPFDYIRKHHPEHTITFYRAPQMSDRFATQLVVENDVVVLSGALAEFPKAYPAILSGADNMGKIAIYDIDDLDWEISKENPVYAIFKERGLEEITKECIKSATVVTVPSRQLARSASQFNSHIEVVPNAIDYDNYFWNLPKKDDGWIRVGWVGGSSHFHDLKLIEGLGKWVIETFPNTKFVLGGFDPCVIGPTSDGMKWLSWDYSDKNVWALYKSVLFGKDYDVNRVDIVPTRHIYVYPLVLKDVDIMLAPLLTNNFNKNKSNLKVIEASARKIPIIASDLGIYSDVIVPSVNGYIAHTAQDWKTYLTKLIEDSNLRKRLGERLYKDMRVKHDISIQAEHRLDIIVSLLKKRMEQRKEFELWRGRFAYKTNKILHKTS